MAELKAVVFSVRNVFFNDSTRQFDDYQVSRLIKLIQYLATKNIKVIFHSNDRWNIARDKSISIAQHLAQLSGEEISYYNLVDHVGMPRKPFRASLEYLLRNEGLSTNEVIYVGCNENDWRSSINANVLFIKANWIKGTEEIPYGFSFDDLAALARFIDICCIQANQTELISYRDENIEYYTLSPFSTMKPQFEAYSASARSTAKKLTYSSMPDFWLMLLIAKIYFSGLYLDINAIIAFPGHKVGFGNSVMDEALDVFVKCFRKAYLHDALIRHTQSIKSQNARNSGQASSLGIYNHLNTLKLNRNPMKFGTDKAIRANQYKNKVILLIDDIATAGYSLDASSLMLKNAGAKRIICFSWLKTINTAFHISTEPLPKSYPIYDAINNAEDLYPASNPVQIPYHSIMSSSSGYEMSRLFEDFINWDVDI